MSNSAIEMLQAGIQELKDQRTKAAGQITEFELKAQEMRDVVHACTCSILELEDAVQILKGHE